MKKLFYVVLIAAVALFAMTFVLQNKAEVTVQYYNLLSWTGPLSALLVIAFCLGAVFAILFAILASLRLRGRLYNSNRKLKRAEASQN